MDTYDVSSVLDQEGISIYPEVPEMKKVMADVESKLKSMDYKLTNRRKHILRVLLENRDKHLSAEEVYNLVKQQAPDVGLATVYRTLELFLLFDIVNGIDFGDGRKRYEFRFDNTEGHHHHHLICTKCGKIISVDEDLLEDLEHRLGEEHEFKVCLLYTSRCV